MGVLYAKITVDDDGYIFVHDDSNYAEVGEFVYDFAFVEMLLDKEYNPIDHKIEMIERIPNPYSRRDDEYFDYQFKEFYRSFLVPNDGKFYFAKVFLPKLVHYITPEGEYVFHDNAIYTDGTNIYRIDAGIYEDPKGELITVDELYDILDEDSNDIPIEIDWYKREFVSITYLNLCLLEKERRILEDFNLKGAAYTCEKASTIRMERDILLDAQRVLNWLLAKDRFDEALAILNKIEGCGGICNGGRNGNAGHNKSGCGCGKSL